MCKLTAIPLARAPGARRQTGATLLEAMISLALSLVVTTAIYCCANSDCGVDGSANQVGGIVIDSGICMTFSLDRDQDNDAGSDPAGGFRRSTIPGGVGSIEMWVGDDESDYTADIGGDWLALTDPDVVDITDFMIDDLNSITESISTEGGGMLTQRIPIWAAKCTVSRQAA